MNRYNDWQGMLALANESLEKSGYSLLITEPEEEGFYDCEIWLNGELIDTYAENFYEDELTELITDAWSHVNGLIRLANSIKRK